MTHDPDHLYELLPVVHRLRDADQGYPLRALLRVVNEQVEVVRDDIAGLYENWFIETCQDWVVPYIGALIGYTPVSTTALAVRDARGQARERILVPRREVANTIRFRRRKGTLHLLEDLAEAVGGWPARAVEFYRLLAVTQNIDYLQMARGRTAELRDGAALQALGGAFDRMARNVDVRRVNSSHARGTANIPEVGVFVWRMRAYRVTRAPAYCYEEESANCFLFSALGNDCQLYVDPRSAGADPPLPLPIGRRDLETRTLDDGQGTTTSGIPWYYGPGKSLTLWTGTPPQLTPVPAESIVAADLSGWSYRPQPGQVALDPVLGRIMFPPTQTRRQPLWVSYSYGFSADLGGGEYPRALSQAPDSKLYQVGPGGFARIADALARWRQDAPAAAVIELTDSSVYAEPLSIELAQGQVLQLRGASGARPLIRMLDWQTSAPDSLGIAGAAGSWFVLEGVMVSGRGLQIGGDISGVTIRHCTLVPGWSLDSGCNCRHPAEPSIEVLGAAACVTIEHSIVGAIRVDRDQALQEPMRLRISDSIVDATAPDNVALGASAKDCADATLSLRRCTVIGQVQTHMIELAEDSILLGQVLACRRQRGCVRFCYVAPGSRTPRRYECQPDLVERAVSALYARGDLDAAQRDNLLQAERLRVEPQFDSRRYGTPGYARLAAVCASEISSGAQDTSEMGVFHDLYQPQRAANLRQRLNEYTPAGSDAGLIYAS